MDWRGIINVQEISTYIQNLPPEILLGESLFPRTKQQGMELKYIKGANEKPVVLKQSTFDVAVKIRALKAQVDELTKQMLFFKESVLINEKDRQDLLMALAAQKSTVVDIVTQRIFDNYKSLVNAGDYQMERMRMQLLADGVINIISEDGNIVFDFGVLSGHKEILAGTAKWSDIENSNPVVDILRWKRQMANEGYSLTRAVTSAGTFAYIAANKNIQKAFAPQNPNYLMGDNEVKAFIQNKTGITLASEEGTYKLEDGSSQPYMPVGKFTLIPDGILGNTYYGTTPEEADKLFGSGQL
ncbi:major capsid protein [Clostridium sp. BJN0013]|uniref:major capsid protein n=1 Tax=Clostridium sp. BJN0013 TaxID=3236840 RepID=UPI0034C6B84F